MRFLTITLICLFVIGAGCFIFDGLNYFEKDTYDFGNGFEIEKDQVNSFKEVVGNEFMICKMKTNHCVSLTSVS